MSKLAEQRVTGQKVYEGYIVKVRVDEVVLPDGRASRREVVETPGAVAMVALDQEGRVALVRQFRYAVGEETIEVPAGKLETGEAPEETARRELAEEVGVTAACWRHLVDIYTSPGFSDEMVRVYLATHLEPAESTPEGEEFLEVEWVPLHQAVAAARSGEIRNAITVCALLMAGGGAGL
ncbi:MAG: NUDIX hydrolase [Bacillota bacterium]